MPRQCGGVERAAQPRPPAGDVALSLVPAAVVVERRQAGERRRLAADMAEFGQTQHDRDGGPPANPRHAEHELQPTGQIRVALQGLTMRCSSAARSAAKRAMAGSRSGAAACPG